MCSPCWEESHGNEKMFWIFTAEGQCVLNLCDEDSLSRLILVEILVLTSEETQ